MLLIHQFSVVLHVLSMQVTAAFSLAKLQQEEKNCEQNNTRSAVIINVNLQEIYRATFICGHH